MLNIITSEKCTLKPLHNTATYLLKMVKMKGLTISSVGKDVAEWGLSKTADGNVKCLENISAVSQEVKYTNST